MIKEINNASINMKITVKKTLYIYNGKNHSHMHYKNKWAQF